VSRFLDRAATVVLLIALAPIALVEWLFLAFKPSQSARPVWTVDRDGRVRTHKDRPIVLQGRTR
jgi:hypothetical protein